MRTQTKIWLGVGAFVIAGTAPVSPSGAATARANLPLNARAVGDPATETALPRVPASGFVLVQHRAAGEAGEGEAGEKGAKVQLPPNLDFALKIALIRGHLLIGDELVKEGQWKAAHPHFLHPVEELYGGIRARLKDYNMPPFETALKVLANTVKSRKRDDYAKALAVVGDALAAADRGMKAKESDWNAFVTETALEALKSATGEYEEAIVKGRIAKPVEYQDARGFIWQAETMLESVAPALEKKDAAALGQVRAGLAELKKAFPTAMPPKTPIKDYPGVLSDVSRIELAAGKLM